MRPRIPIAVVASLVVQPFVAQGAAHDDYLDGAHWDVPASVTDGPRPAVLILDATGDPRVLGALRAFKAHWNAMRAEPSMAVLPAVELKTAVAAAACADRGLRAASGATAHVVVCLRDELANAAVGGPYIVDAQGHTTLGLVKMRTSTLSWTPCHLRTAVAHELGHVMGLAHNDAEAFAGGPSLMMSGNGPYRYGCPVWFNAHDRDALAGLYRAHAARCSVTGHRASDPDPRKALVAVSRAADAARGPGAARSLP